MDNKEKKEAIDDAELNRRKKEVADLIEKAKGKNRSYADYAKLTGVSTASFSRMKKGDYLPSPKTIRNLTSEAADPQGGVTYDEMMRAAGYVTEEPDYAIELAGMGEDKIHIVEKSNSLRDSRQSDRLKNYSKRLFFEKEVASKIYTMLVENGMMFRKKDEEEVKELYGGGNRPDLEIAIMDQKIKDWAFEFIWFPQERHYPGMHFLFHAMGYALKMRFHEGMKLTYVINSKQTFQYFERFDHALSFRGELSILLYDSDENRFVDEVYLANYHEEDRSKELYLIGSNQ